MRMGFAPLQGPDVAIARPLMLTVMGPNDYESDIR